jgi:hypothetical protein
LQRGKSSSEQQLGASVSVAKPKRRSSKRGSAQLELSKTRGANGRQESVTLLTILCRVELGLWRIRRFRTPNGVYLFGAGLRKRVGGSNRKWGGGSDDVFPFSSQTQSEPNLASDLPSAGETTLHTESRLSAFTVMIRFMTSSDVMCSDL